MMTPGEMNYFKISDNDELIRKRVAVSPNVITNLGAYGIAEGTRLIEVQLKSVYTPTPQTIRLIREVCGIALAYFKSAYTDGPCYKARCNTLNLVPNEPRNATALIGLGGCGKTQLLRAISRLVSPAGAEFNCPGLPIYPVQPIWILTMVAGKTLSNLLEPYVASGGNTSAILVAAAKRAFTNGVGLTGLDESQFITATQQGHAKAAELLMRLTYIGPPLIYVANFTLINKLQLRPQQERDRLLSNIIAMHPEEYESKAFTNILSDQLTVLSEAASSDSAISAKNHANDIHNYTYGINRKSAILLNHAWRISRARGSSVLTMDDIQSSYKSDLYRSHREEVELLRAQSNSRCMARKDLWCDFSPPPTYRPIQSQPPATPDSGTPSNVITVPELQAEKEKRIAEGMALETLSQSEREAYDLVTNQCSKPTKPKARVVGLRNEDKSLAALQQAGYEMLEQFLPKS